MFSHVALNYHFSKLDDRIASIPPTELTSSGQRGENTSAWLLPEGKDEGVEAALSIAKGPFLWKSLGRKGAHVDLIISC